MDPSEDSQWSVLDAVFTEALARPEAERAAWLHAQFADDPETLEGVTRLLRQESDSRRQFDTLMSLRDRIAEDLSGHLDDSAEDPRIGACYGPWRILRRIASGGLSVVYEACRSDGRYEQSVALKVMHGGLHNGEAIRHFLRERRILSSLDHPGIVRILDGGETATGAPWFVMDLVVGKLVADYCRERGLELTARLGLVADVADAVQSAHARLVVHRDIKPDNIIVSEEGRIRLLDFGVSSLFSGDEAEEAGRGMTPEYASPEQLRLEPVTTASDIWQLGRVLKDLCEPFEPLPGALRAVIDKSTAEHAADRYESASSLAEDIRLLMRGQAPRARPDSRWEATIRFARRNRVAAVLAGLLIFGLIGWAATLSVHAREMEQQRSIAIAAADRAERGRDVLLNLFRRMDPLERDGVATTGAGVDAILDHTLDEVRERLPDDPRLQAELVGWAARIRQRNGDLDAARALAEEGVVILRDHGDTSSTTYAAALAYLGHLDMLRGATELSQSELAEAVALANRAPPTDAQAFDAILSAAWSSGSDWQTQIGLLNQALPRALATGSVNGEIEVRSGLGRALGNLGKAEEGEVEIRKALEIALAAYGEDHPRMTLPLSALGRILFLLGRPEEAVEAHRKAVRIAVASYGENSEEVLMHRNNLAIALSASGETAEAISELKAVASIRQSLEGPDSLSVGEVLQNLAVEQSASGQFEEALATLDQAEPILSEKLPEGSPRRAFPALTRSAILIELRQYDEAGDAAAYAFDILKTTLPEGHYATEIARCRMGMAELGRGNKSAAQPLIAQALTALAKQVSAPKAYVQQCEAAGRQLGIVD